MSTAIVVLLSLIVCELAYLIYHICLFQTVHSAEHNTDPMFTVFSRDIVLRVWMDVKKGEVKYDEANAYAGGPNGPFTKDISVAEKLWDAELEYRTDEECLRRMYEANFAAIRGEDIQKLREGHSKWFIHRRTVEDVGAKMEARRRFLERNGEQGRDR